MRCDPIRAEARAGRIATLSRVIVLALALLSVHAPAGADDPGLDYDTSWVGNSFGGADDRWVQNFIIHMGVKDDGTVYTWSHWDEGGRRYGHYRDGDVVGNENLEPNSLKTVDHEGRVWEIIIEWTEPEPDTHNEYDFIPQHIECDGEEVGFPKLYEPTAVAMANDGTLMVACSWMGPRQQVLFYDVSDWRNPELVKEFGEYGGIRAGTRGEVTPTKFWGIRGIGMDAEGNIYVGMSEMGTVIRSLTPDGELNWELYGLFFCDLAYPDPADDARTVWGIQERFDMNYDRPPGEEATWTHYTLDRQTYPDDPRGLMYVKQQGEHGLTSPQVVYLEGERFMFVGGMFASNFINIFRWDGQIAVPAGLIVQWDHGLYRTDLTWPPNRPEGEAFIWRDRAGDGQYNADEFEPNTQLVRPGPFWVDSAGDIWMPYGFFRYHFQGLDEYGNPIYTADDVTDMDVPEPMEQVARVWYDRERDILVAAEEGRNMRHIDEVFIYHGYLAGNDDDPVRFSPGAGERAGTMTAAGDYVFTGGWQERGRIWINRLSDGEKITVLEPGENVGGVEATGWIDVLTGIAAHQREDGEYLIFVEENYRGKSLMYRWRPSE